MIRALVPLLLLAACDDGAKDTGDDTVPCTEEARASVQLTLTDSAGAPLEGATVTYATEGVDPQACESFVAGEYVCGYEVAGDITIAMSAEGFVSDELIVTVLEDECHVITEMITHALEELECTAEYVPALIVNVTDSQGAEVTGATVTWWNADADADPEACEGGGETNTWTCAYEESGNIAVRVEGGGPYEPHEEIVAVEHDGCHPVTEVLDVVLSYLPD